jgi:hypothetical protein
MRGSGKSWPWSGANRTGHDVREDSAGDRSCGVGCACDCPPAEHCISAFRFCGRLWTLRLSQMG